MPRFIKQILLVVLLAVATRAGFAFSLLGPFETWQTAAIGYNPLGGEIGAPKNIGEEYRWNLPVITYGFDNSFISYFGSNGVAAIDKAFNILNSIPAFSTLSVTLDEYPLLDPDTGAPTTFRDSRRNNFRAQADNLLDLKSEALGLVVEELGLANPERWVWALRDRRVVGNPPVTNYLVIERNFDPVSLQPSKYVNGTRYVYDTAPGGSGGVQEFAVPTAFADVIEVPVDPVNSFSSVAGISGFLDVSGFGGSGLVPGVFYTYLTRDDIGGLRYLYTKDERVNPPNWEPFPAGTQIFAPDPNGFTTVSNFDLTLFSVQSLTNPPSVLTNLYPGLIINSVSTNFVPFLQVMPLSTQIFVSIITNRGDLQIVTGLDLVDFSNFTLTNPPAIVTNNAIYPGLEITGFTQSLTQRQVIVSIVLTNGPKFPWGDPFQTNFVFFTNYVTTLEILYHYTFANVITNDFSPITRVRRITSGLDKEPWGDPLNPTFRTNIVDSFESVPSGNILILNSNVLSFELAGIPVRNVQLVTNYLNQTNFVANGVVRTIFDAQFRLFTNVLYPVNPIIALTGGFFTNIVVGTVTNQAAIYNYTFANVVTNYSGITPMPLTLNVVSPNGVTNTLFTTTNFIAGGFLIDTNLTGFNFVPNLETRTLIPTTIVLSDVFDAQGNRIQREISYIFTNTVYGVLPFTLQPAPPSLLRPGIDKLRFVRIGNGTIQGNDFNFTNNFQASYWTNGALVTSTFQRVQTLPDILFQAADLGTVANDVVPLTSARSANFQNNAALNSQDPNQGGPGTINPTVVITFNKVGPGYINQFPGFVTESSAVAFRTQIFVWGSFDGSTNAPIVYPRDLSLEQIETRMVGTANP
jgi:hypothetical protein